MGMMAVAGLHVMLAAAPLAQAAGAVIAGPQSSEPAPSGQTSTHAWQLLDSARDTARSESRKQPPTLGGDANARFHADLEAATAKKWTGIAKVTETTMPGTGERLYKISNGTSTYCLRIPSPSVGIDRYEWARNNQHAIKCPR
jgi:hypothetical protein